MKTAYIPATHEVKLIYVIGLLHQYPDMTDEEVIDNILDLTGKHGFNCSLKALIKEAREIIARENR